MPDSYAVFVNYRTGDEETAAAFIHSHLARLLGKERVFFDSTSIRGGELFPRKLLSAVRRSDVLLAVIGTEWATFAHQDGGPALLRADDWIHRELKEALTCGVPVIPILVGERGRLKRDELPEALAPLIDVQYLRFDHRSAAIDLGRITDEVAAHVPGLADATGQAGQGAPRRADDRSPAAEVSNTAGDVHGTSGQFHDMQAEQVTLSNSGNVLNRPTGPVHTGQHGVQLNGGQDFSGGGDTFFGGDHRGPAPRRRRDRESGTQ
ncbi:toll/interleukin-1 receptor domain-containing protein [Streptomyces marincola]|uniref:toll/interleukin-1 receptor domain-containing protein n=1 Tax=Streptomyces marincola TaxID=2878388 RepID=UPI001CF4D9C1|nr:toll/interleukin-1 receptor domain-containing protein [Streptomyces marincola]UCM87809.1 toll/interleukin-1 receptor domain-containing protein [Streptomyces marincola]